MSGEHIEWNQSRGRLHCAIVCQETVRVRHAADYATIARMRVMHGKRMQTHAHTLVRTYAHTRRRREDRHARRLRHTHTHGTRDTRATGEGRGREDERQERIIGTANDRKERRRRYWEGKHAKSWIQKLTPKTEGVNGTGTCSIAFSLLLALFPHFALLTALMLLSLSHSLGMIIVARFHSRNDSTSVISTPKSDLPH